MILVDRSNVVYPRGVYMELYPPGDYVSDVIRSTGDFYERVILDEIARRITGGVLVDVGAMIGTHTVFLAAFVPHSAIHAFEPLPANLELLRRNVGGFPTVKVYPHALSDDGRVGSLTVDAGNLGHVSFTDNPAGPVYAYPLDWYELQNVTLVKIDVEGHEPQVLVGARKTIERWHPLIVIEDWSGMGYGDLLPGYQVVAEWETQHQTFMYEWEGDRGQVA